jgi:hypothetical protein
MEVVGRNLPPVHEIMNVFFIACIYHFSLNAGHNHFALH